MALSTRSCPPRTLKNDDARESPDDAVYSPIVNQAARSSGWRFSRRATFIYLLVSLGISAFAGQAYVQSLFLEVPPDTQKFTGIVRKVRYSYGRYDNVTGIHFQLGAPPRDFVYVSFFPSFDEVMECVIEGATVSLSTSSDGSDIWSVTCLGRREHHVTPSELLESRRANGRAAAWVSIGFLAASGISIWLIATGRAA